MPEMTIKEYAQKVQECRQAQKNYFRIVRNYGNSTEKNAALEHSKKLERELDALTAIILSGQPAAKQNELFTNQQPS